MNLQDKKPIISSSVFLAPNATVIGNVELAPSSSVWYGAVLRGDTAPIQVSERANVQDRAVVHAPSAIGAGSSICAGAVVDGAAIGAGCVVGSGAIVSRGASVRDGAVVRAGAVVPPGTVIRENEVWAGVPAVREGVVDDEERAVLETMAGEFVQLADAHAVETGKTHAQIEAEALREGLLSERSEDYNSHMGLIGREEEIVETQARLVEEDRRLQRAAGEV